MKRSSPVVSREGFTLVELLVVIGIIVILMSLLLTAIPAVKESARKLEAKNTAMQIVTAANAYYTEYAKFPPLGDPTATTQPDPTLDQWVGDEGMSAPQRNNVLFFTLRNISKGPNEDFAMNPRKVVFFDGKSAIVSSANKPRGGFFDRDASGGKPPEDKEGCLYDPWGRQYGVMLDTNWDDQIDLKDAYSDFGGVGNDGKAPRKKAGAFSSGKDEMLGKKGDKNYRSQNEVSDDVVSWE